MPAPVFIGDEVTAVGYRLTGVRVCSPEPGEAASTFEQALTEAHLVLITAEYAARVPGKALERALALIAPLVLVVPDARGRVPVPDLARRVRGQLGMAG